VSPAAACFAKELTAAASPESVNRAKAFLFAASRLGAFGESVGLLLQVEVLLHPTVIERCCAPRMTTMSAPTRRAVRANLRAIARALRPGPPVVALGRERAKALYSPTEFACYLALAGSQGTEARRMRAGVVRSSISETAIFSRSGRDSGVPGMLRSPSVGVGQ